MSDVKAKQGVARESNSTGENGLSEEGIITCHRVLEAFGSDSQGLDSLRSDLFDSRPKIVLSALAVLGKIKDQKSVGHITRLFTHKDEEIQCAAVEAIGQIGHSEGLKILLNLFRTSKDEQLRIVILKTLSTMSPNDPEVIALVRVYAGSMTVRAETRAFAKGILLKLDDNANTDQIISGALSDNILMEEVLRVAGEIPEMKDKVINKTTGIIHRLSAENRILLIPLVSPFSTTKSLKILLESIKDSNPEIRRACYQAIGKEDKQRPKFGQIVELLSQSVEESPALEEEALLAIGRIEECLARSGNHLLPQLKKKVSNNISELYGQLSSSSRRGVGDTHELGWIITRSKEYLEYYGDEDLKQAIIRYIKGSSNYTAEELMRSVKNSAVKVEVRHFDGYNALLSIIKDPKRAGMSLVTRELSVARLGKRKIMYQLIRNLHISKLFQSAGEDSLFNEIYIWAKEAKLYRLAEAALYALSTENVRKTEAACIECMTPPVPSKILAIASIRLLKKFQWGQIEPGVVKLMEGTRDPYVLLNLIDALAVSNFPFSSGLIKTVMNRLVFDTDQEMLSRVAGFLSEKADSDYIDDCKRIFDRSQTWKKPLILSIIQQIVVKRQITADVGLSEFLYKVFREEDGKCKAHAVAILYGLGDDYALKVMQDLLGAAGHDEKVEAVRGLRGILKRSAVPVLGQLFYDDSGILHEVLRESLLSTEDKETRNDIVKLVLKYREHGVVEEGTGYGEKGEEVKVDFSHEKKAFKFEREHILKSTVLFTDIKGYSQKAQQLTSMELTKLIQEYEDILLPVTLSHDGELIKRMGDGHLFVFQEPLFAVLSGIRLQKALKRYNSFREEKFRITIRIGVHWGDIVRKGNDVFGNTVNIASRLETSAREGSIYISREVNEEVKKYILSKKIGLIRVKGIENPIMVFEPYEISVDLPAELDPSSRNRASIAQSEEKAAGSEENADTEQQKMAVQETEWNINKKIIGYLKQTFVSLNNLALKVEKGEAGAPEIRKELIRRWQVLRRLFKKGA